MRFLIPHLITAFILTLLKLSEVRSAKTDERYPRTGKTVRLSKVNCLVGIVDVVGFSALITLMLVFPNSTAAPWVYAVFSGGCFLGFYLVYSALAWRIDYSEEQEYFIYRSLLFRMKTIYYKDSFFLFERDQLIIWAETSSYKIHIPKNARGYEHFSALVRNRARHSIRAAK